MKYGTIAIIGAGSVGSTTAYALCLKQIAAEIILIDADEKRCTGEILDLSDIQAIIPSTRIKKGTYTDACDSTIIIIAAGKKQCPGESREALYEANASTIRSICAQLQSIHPDAVVIIVTNPVDPLTRIIQQCLPLKPNQIFGSGTLLESLRLRKHIGAELAVSPQSVNAFVVGKHGDSQVILWSSISVGGTPLNQFTQLSEDIRQDIAQKTKNEAYEIIACKGATFFGVATCVARICKAIMFDENIVLPVSCLVKEQNICISLPVILGKKGIIDYVPFYASASEQEQLKKSIESLHTKFFTTTIHR